MDDFEQIYKDYFSDVYRFLLSLSGNEALAEEITQETFFKAMKNLDSFDGRCKISVWLCQIAKNTYYSHWKKEQHITTDVVEDASSEDMVEHDILAEENLMYLHKILHNLEEPYKEVFQLRVFGELSFSQIGEIFDHTETWARVTFYRSKAKVQTKLKGEES